MMGYPGMEEYRARAERLGVSDRFTFTGRVPYEDAARYLRLGDVALAPKLSLTEGAGKILNYMACGLPTVAFDTPQAREYMAQYGLYAERGQAAALADRLIDALAQADQRSALGAALRQRAAQRFNLDDSICRILAVYDAVRSRPRRRASRLQPSKRDFNRQ
jgi:glycosyltransferase involved in cell wall biosynthesis